MRKYILLLICLLCQLAAIYAQETTIKGKIYSKNKPVEFAHIALLPTSLGTISDSLGYFEIPKIPSGQYDLKISAVGFKDYQKIITITHQHVIELTAELEENAKELEEIVVTGTLKETFLTESCVPIEVFTPTFFKKNPTPSIFEALQNVNGVRPQMNCNVCGTGDIHINGMEGAYTMILIDGMPIVSSLATVYGLNGIPNSIVERIEIVKGAASTLFGSEAVGGLINIITKNIDKTPKLTLDNWVSSHGEWNIDGIIKFTSSKINTLISANYFQFGQIGDVNHDNFTDIPLQNRISVFNKYAFKRKNDQMANLAIRYIYEDRWGGEKQWSLAYRGGDVIYGESIYTKRWEIIGNYQLPIPTEKILLGFSLNLHDQNSVYGNVQYLAKQHIAFGQMLWDKKIGKHDGLLGVSMRYTFYDDNTTATSITDGSQLLNLPDRTWLPSIFLQDEIKLLPKHTLLLGGRYDYYARHGSVWSARLNHKWAINPQNTLRFSIGNGFRVVNLFTEDHAALTGSREVEIRNTLRPERSWNFNLNYQKNGTTSFAEIKIDVGAFYTYFTNKIVPDYDSDPNKIIYDNLSGYAVSRGVNINWDIAFDIPLNVLLGMTWMDVYQIEKNDQQTSFKIPQIHASPFSGSFTISYALEKLGISIDWTGNFFSPMPLPVFPNDFRPAKSPWYSLQNIQLTQKFKRIELYVGIKNIFNFLPNNPLMRPFDPFDKQIELNNPNGYTFDTAYNYAPIQGIRGFGGVKFNL